MDLAAKERKERKDLDFGFRGLTAKIPARQSRNQTGLPADRFVTYGLCRRWRPVLVAALPVILEGRRDAAALVEIYYA
jgi:hypothetical protein